jgi:O-methyltransferase.
MHNFHRKGFPFYDEIPGLFIKKLEELRLCPIPYRKIVHKSSFEDVLFQFRHHFLSLRTIIESSDDSHLPSDCFFDTDTDVDQLLNTRLNIFSLAKRCYSILEIGFRGGFTALLMLISNNYCKITVLDDGAKSYTLKCFEYLKLHFKDRIDILIGDIHESLQKLNTSKFLADLIHINGDIHNYNTICHANVTFFISLSLTSCDTIIIWNGCRSEPYRNSWQGYIKTRRIKPVTMLLTRRHSIGIIVK